MESWPKPKAPAAEKEPATLGSMDTVETKEDFIKAVDFNTLNDIFDQLAVRSGGPEHQFGSGHRVIPEKVYFYEKGENPKKLAGEAYPDKGSIFLDWQDVGIENRTSYIMTQLSSLVHEATHIRAGYEKTFHYQDQKSAEQSNIKTGYFESKQGRTRKDGREQGYSLNEAVTETLALEILDEYLRRTGTTKYLDDPVIARELSSHVYLEDRIALAVVIEALSYELELPRDEVWKAFVQGYMSGKIDLDQLATDMHTSLIANEAVSELTNILVNSDSTVEKVWDRKTIDSLLVGLPKFEDQEKVLRQVMEGFGRENIEHALGLR